MATVEPKPNVRTLVSKPMLERIIAAACQYFNCAEEELFNKSTKADIAYRKKICWYVVKENVLISYGSLAQRSGLSYKSHGWIMEGIEEMRSQKHIYRQIADDIANIQKIADNLAA